MNADIDDALIALFAGEPGAEEWLTGFGVEAFQRVMGLYRGRLEDFPERLAGALAGPGSAAAERWANAVSVVAWANPGLYVDQLGERLGILDVVILGTIEDERVVGILARALHREEWLVRYHAVRSFGQRPEPEARQHLRAALTDGEEKVRREATEALARLPELP